LTLVDLVSDDRVQSDERLLRSEGRLHARTDAVRIEELGHVARVDQDVVVAFVVAAPRAVLVARERGHLSNKPIGCGERHLRDESPVVGDPGSCTSPAALTPVPTAPRSQQRGDDGTVQLFDPGNGRQPLILRGHTLVASGLSLSPDGTRLASASPDATVRIWALDLDDPIAISEHEVTPELTDDECRQYLHVATCP
jgi:hypothetical protein